jgi:hypothetical protein
LIVSLWDDAVVVSIVVDVVVVVVIATFCLIIRKMIKIDVFASFNFNCGKTSVISPHCYCVTTSPLVLCICWKIKNSLHYINLGRVVNFILNLAIALIWKSKKPFKNELKLQGLSIEI